MGRPIRFREPGTFHFVGLRCVESRFLMRPDPELNELFGYWLGRALLRYLGIALYGVVAMSNHFHMVLRDGKPGDPEGQLSGFMWYLNTNLAKAINHLRGREIGPVFDGRYFSAPLLDTRAVVDEMAYLITNPAEAGLVDRHEDWPGILIYAPTTPRTTCFRWLDHGACHGRNPRAGDRSVGRRADFARTAEVTVLPLPFSPPGDETSLLIGRHLLSLFPEEKHALANLPHQDCTLVPAESATVQAVAQSRAQEDALRQRRALEGRRCLGADRVLSLDPLGSPIKTKHSPRPICLTSSPELWMAFCGAWTRQRRWYAEASRAFRSGNFETHFPPYAALPAGPRLRSSPAEPENPR